MPHGQLPEAAGAPAHTIMAPAPLAVEYAKEATVHGLELPLKQGLKIEAGLSILLRATEDRVEGARAFKEKRPAPFKGN